MSAADEFPWLAGMALPHSRYEQMCDEIDRLRALVAEPPARPEHDRHIVELRPPRKGERWISDRGVPSLADRDLVLPEWVIVNHAPAAEPRARQAVIDAACAIDNFYRWGGARNVPESAFVALEAAVAALRAGRDTPTPDPPLRPAHWEPTADLPPTFATIEPQTPPPGRAVPVQVPTPEPHDWSGMPDYDGR